MFRNSLMLSEAILSLTIHFADVHDSKGYFDIPYLVKRDEVMILLLTSRLL